MAKNSFFKKLVRQFDSIINNYPAANSEFGFAKFEKIILIQKKDNRYYRAIQQFLVYLRKCKDNDELIFISKESEKECQRSLEKLESLLVKQLEEKARLSAEATVVKKSNFKSFVMQPFLTMLFFLQIFTKQIITARPLQVSRYTKQANHCKNSNSEQCDDQNLDMRMYQDDLQKNLNFFRIVNQKQSIEFKFKDTIFILTKNCISRQNLAKIPQGMCRPDYVWFLESMAIYHIRKKVRTEAQKQGLSLDKADVAQITQYIYSKDPIQQDARQLMGINHLGNFCEPELEKFIFNAKYTPDPFQSIPHEENSNYLLSRVNNAINSEIEKRKKLKPEESKVFTSLNRKHYSRPETQSAIDSVLQTDIITTSSISNRSVDRSAEDFNWKIIGSAAVAGIGVIVFIVAIIIWYSKKNRSENSTSAMELNPLINSIPDSLHVRKLVDRLVKRLGFLKSLDRYDEEIGIHYISFRLVKSKEEAIENLDKIKKSLTKFIEFEKTKLKNKDKLESALLIVKSLMQRYKLLSLPNINSSKIEYISEQLKSGLEDSINSMLDSIEIIRYNFKGNFFRKHNIKKDTDKFKYLDLLLNSEKAVYETMLSAHAEGYFEEYPRELITNCLNLNINTIYVVNNEIDLKNIKELQGDLLSTIGFILIPLNSLYEELLKLKDKELNVAIKSSITKLECMKSQLVAYFADRNARRDEASRLKSMQSSDVSVNSTFFGQQQPSSQIIPPTQRYTMHR